MPLEQLSAQRHRYPGKDRKVVDLANQILKENVDRLKQHAAEVMRSLDTDAIHDMRVATRRLRAALKTFKKALPNKAQKWRTELQKMSRILGKRRDLDVFMGFTHQIVNRDLQTLPKLSRHIEQANKQIFSQLKSKWFAKLIVSLQDLEVLETKNISPKKKIRKALERILELAPSIDTEADDAALHKLRISIKKLRYICEFFEPLDSSLPALIKKTKKMQDILGDYQDTITGDATLINYKREFSEEEFLLIKKRYALKRRKVRYSFTRTWKNFLA